MWLTRDKEGVVIWAGNEKPEKVKGVYLLKSTIYVDYDNFKFKQLFGFLPRKGSIKEFKKVTLE